MSPEKMVQFVVNGNQVALAHPPGWTLLDALRRSLGLTGAKRSCDGDGTCGSCMVIVDGAAETACTLPLERVGGSVVQTIEGLSSEGELHPLQKAFVLDHVMQCGYSTAGQIMVAKGLLDANPSPTREQVIHSLDRVI